MSKAILGRLALCGAALVSACGGRPHGSAAETGKLVAAQAFDQVIESPAANTLTGAGTTAVAATVFIPQHREGERYPLIIHSHGWGGNRIDAVDAETNNRNADTSTLYSRLVDLEVKRLWDAGYAVISFDQRGINQSEGQVRVMDPAYETRDAIAVLDWAEGALALARDAYGDPLVGTIGGSYGGGFQLLFAALDPRVDAITPSVTWYDLNDALQDGDVLEKAWLTGLCAVAKADQRRLDPVIQLACAEAADQPLSRFSEDLHLSGEQATAYFREHSLAAFARRHADAADAYRMQPVNALFIQGMRDTLFPLNEAWRGYRFLRGLGGDVRLLTHQHGHILPAPFSKNPALGGTNCGAVDTLVAMRAFLDAKLRGRIAALEQIPQVCLSLDDEAGIVLSEVPRGGPSLAFEAVTVTAAHSNLPGGQGPVFVPLGEPLQTEGWVLAGIPTARLSVTSPVAGRVGVAFIAVGVQRGKNPPYPVDYQVRALRSDRRHEDIELYGIGERLQVGDRVGLLIYGGFDEFEVAGQTANYAANAATVEGVVQLPLVEASRVGIVYGNPARLPL